jgi:hypothetical protein
MKTVTAFARGEVQRNKGAEVYPEAARSSHVTRSDSPSVSPCVERQQVSPRHRESVQQECYERRELTVNSENSRTPDTMPIYERCS